MTTTHCQLLRLPQEIIISAIEILPYNDILRLSETCQSLYRLIRSSASIQYQIEKYVAGVVDGGSSLSSADCLALLKKTERNWAVLRFSRMEKLKRRQGGLWELFGGVLAFSDHSSEPLSLYRSLSFIQLPSALCGTTSKIHRLENLGSYIRDFGMDPSQDLLIAVEMRQGLPKYFVNLLTISTGQPHPLASKFVLPCSDRAPYIHYNFVIQVMGDYLGIVLHTTLQGQFIIVQDQFLLWNWKTGHNVLRLSPCRNNNRYDSFSFISPNHVVLSRVQPMPGTEDSPSLEIYEFHEFSWSTERTIVDPPPYRTFLLPELNSNVIATSVTTRSDPSPGCLGVVTAGSPRPFTTSPNSRLFTACLELIRDLEVVVYVMFFIHQETLLSEQLPFQPSGKYQWDEWGPQYSRSLELENYQPTWVCYVHGMRFVRGVSVRGSIPSAHRLEVLDFNPFSIRRYGDYGEPNVEVVDQDDVIPKRRGIFADDVVTSLPFRRSTSIETYSHSDFMIDEDVVIGFHWAAMSSGRERDMMFLSV